VLHVLMLPDLENRVGSGAGSEDALHHPRDWRTDQKADPDNEHQASEAPHGPIIDHRRDQPEPGLRLLGR
jgi:hypothetical protein